MRGMVSAIQGAVTGVLVAVLVGGVATSSAIAFPTYEVYGWVTDRQSGEPISGAVVELFYDNGTSWVLEQTTTTDPTGYYTFTGLAVGPDRYADFSHSRHRHTWLEASFIGVAAKLPDALAGGATMGNLHGPLVITNGTVLTPETRSFLERWDTGNDLGAFALGGPNSLSESVRQDMITALVP